MTKREYIDEISKQIDYQNCSVIGWWICIVFGILTSLLLFGIVFIIIGAIGLTVSNKKRRELKLKLAEI